MESLGQDSNCRPLALWTSALPLRQHNIREREETKRLQTFYGQVFAPFLIMLLAFLIMFLALMGV